MEFSGTFSGSGFAGGIAPDPFTGSFTLDPVETSLLTGTGVENVAGATSAFSSNFAGFTIANVGAEVRFFNAVATEIRVFGTLNGIGVGTNTDDFFLRAAVPGGGGAMVR